MTKCTGSRSGGLMANTFPFPLQFIAHFRLISQNSFLNAETIYIPIGSPLCQEQCRTVHLLSGRALNAISIYWMKSLDLFAKDHTKSRWNLTLTPFLSHLTQSAVLHQDSKNTLAVASLCSLVFHFIIVPIVSLVPSSCNFSQLIMQSLKWQPQTHLPSSWLPRIHKPASKERLYLEEKQLQLSVVITYYSG